MSVIGKPPKTASKALPIINELREHRAKQMVKLSDLAKRGGYLEHQVSSWERGKHIPSLANFCNLANVLGLRVKLVKED